MCWSGGSHRKGLPPETARSELSGLVLNQKPSTKMQRVLPEFDSACLSGRNRDGSFIQEN